MQTRCNGVKLPVLKRKRVNIMADDQSTQTWREEAAQLRAEIDRVDDWANGVFLALFDLLPPLLREHPQIAATIAPMWKKAAQNWDTLQTGTMQGESFDEPEGVLEARKLLYRMLAQHQVFPEHAPR